jgi:hypothetical protein
MRYMISIPMLGALLMISKPFKIIKTKRPSQKG